LLVDVVACVHSRQIVSLLSLVVVKFFDVGLENTATLMHLLASFLSEFVSDRLEIALVIKQSVLLVPQDTALFVNFYAQLSKCFNLNCGILHLFDAHVSNLLHKLANLRLFFLNLLLRIFVRVSVNDKLRHSLGKCIYSEGFISLVECALLAESYSCIFLRLSKVDQLSHVQRIAQLY
jgi:hypothetical protein